MRKISLATAAGLAAIFMSTGAMAGKETAGFAATQRK
jgi:hypothetical protein